EQVGLTGGAVSEDGALDAGDDGLNIGFVEAENGSAVERDAVDELGEGVLNIGERGVLVEVLAVNGGNNGYDGRKEEEAAIAFVGLDNEIFAAAETRGGSGLIDFAADDERGVEVSGGEDGGDQGGGGGLAVGATDRNAVFEAHQLSQHFGARDDWNF